MLDSTESERVRARYDTKTMYEHEKKKHVNVVRVVLYYYIVFMAAVYIIIR